MKKGLFLMVSVLILGLVFTGCGEIAKFSSPAMVNTDSELYKCCECFGPESATGLGERIIKKKNGGGTWFMYNEYPGANQAGNVYWYPIHAGSPKNGTDPIGSFWVMNRGGGFYSVRYGVEPAFVVLEEHLGIDNDDAKDGMDDFTAKPGKDDNQDFANGSPPWNDEDVEFYDDDGIFYIFAHFEVDCAPEY